jgi:hypothetical protein
MDDRDDPRILMEELRAAVAEVKNWPDWKKREAGIQDALETIEHYRAAEEATGANGKRSKRKK